MEEVGVVDDSPAKILESAGQFVQVTLGGTSLQDLLDGKARLLLGLKGDVVGSDVLVERPCEVEGGSDLEVRISRVLGSSMTMD